MARDASDVSEFAQRLKLSDLLLRRHRAPGTKESGKGDKLDLVTFALQMKVRY